MTPKQKCIEDMIADGAEMAHLIRVLRQRKPRADEDVSIGLRADAAPANWDSVVREYRKLTQRKA